MAGRSVFDVFRRTGEPPRHGPPSVPDGVLLYAIGDIHGRYDLLNALLDEIQFDAGAHPGTKILVCVGDYVDRGPDSRRVIERLLGGVKPFETVCLRGNHEQVLLDFLADPRQWEHWRRYGGLDTLMSYGIAKEVLLSDSVAFEQIRDAFHAALPDAHYQFLNSLKTNYDCGDYYFVHAGARPGVALDLQTPQDQLWIREEFLHAGNAFGGRVIVHGHTPRRAPERHPFRIGIDTGAYFSDTLTAARFFGTDVTFLQT